MKKLLLFFTILIASQVSAQCPYLSTCPSIAPLYCDYSTNDTLLWKSAPFTWNPSLMLTNLPKGDVDISVVARDSCVGQDVSVEYTLFLDLDGNDTVETVIPSNALPPSGKVLYNNILSPNYDLGDTIEFDHRTGLPDSMKYILSTQPFDSPFKMIAGDANKSGSITSFDIVEIRKLIPCPMLSGFS